MAASTSRKPKDGGRFRGPHLQTTFHRQPTLEKPGSSIASANNYEPPATPIRTQPGVIQDDNVADAPAGYQRFVLTDPLAFRYLEEDPSTRVISERRELEGYECYIVEQWSTSRSHPTFTITTYTGDPSHSIFVSVLSVPVDERTWSARLRVYFKALNQYHARRRETPLGILMVTNLSGFPSSLTVISVPDGDLRKHRANFYINEDLKRLNCAGRVGLTLLPPAAATAAKFHQLYRTSDKNDIYDSVVELVKLCQSALTLFGKLEIDYADGLLCDVTERAINDWWLEMGSSHYNIEPHDGILGPTTVAGLLGLLMGARNRLHAVNAPVGKDAFDANAMKRGISYFQKQHRLERTRRLDRKTLDRLHRTTAKAANSDGHWAVPKAVKSTVAELSGKGGEMVMDVVGRRDRAGIAEIETCDIDRFVQLVQGEKAKWLWYGKPVKKTNTKEPVGLSQKWGPSDGRQLSFREGDHGGFTWTARKSVADGLTGGRREPNDDAGTPDEHETDEEEGIQGVLKRTSGFKEARSGIGKLKGAVGLGSGSHHKHSSSKDDSPKTPRSPQSPRAPQWSTEETISPTRNSKEQQRRPLLGRAHSSPVSSFGSPQSPVQEQRQRVATAESIMEYSAVSAAPGYAASFKETQGRPSIESLRPPSVASRNIANGELEPVTDDAESVTVGVASVNGSAYNDEPTDAPPKTGPDIEQNINRLMKRTVSYSRVIETNLQTKSEDAYPRHLSFSLAEESVLSWESIASNDEDASYDDLQSELVSENYTAFEYKQLRQQIDDLSTNTVSFTQAQLYSFASLLTKSDEDHQTIESIYRPHSDHMHALQTDSEGIVRAERERLAEAGKEIETLAAKLDYEINGLKGRVEEVEAGVEDFARGVGRVEDRVRELEKEKERAESGRWACVVS